MREITVKFGLENIPKIDLTWQNFESVDVGEGELILKLQFQLKNSLDAPLSV
jgi:hypothetical protein